MYLSHVYLLIIINLKKKNFKNPKYIPNCDFCVLFTPLLIRYRAFSQPFHVIFFWSFCIITLSGTADGNLAAHTVYRCEVIMLINVHYPY